MVKLSKRYRACTEAANLAQPFPLQDAVGVLYKMPVAKFDETVEISAYLGVDPRQSDQMVRGTVNLPHGSGKKVRVLVFTENPQEARDAGAEFVGLDDMIAKIQEGWLDFDVALSTPTAMKDVRKVSRLLGPRGLMPNPKSGTVTTTVPDTVQSVKAGRVEFKMDKTANIHVIVGKRSFTPEQIVENTSVAIDALLSVCPENFKGSFIKNIVLSATMTPAVKLHSDVFTRDR